MKKDLVQPARADAYRVAYLVAGFIRNILTDEERDELDEWVVASDENMQLFAELTDDDNMEQSLAQLEGIDKGEEWKKLLNRITENKPARTTKRFWLYAAAAAVILIAGLFFIYRYTTAEQVKTIPNNTLAKTDILPGGNKATLTIDGGTVIDLSTAPNGVIKKTNGTVINKITDDALNYKALGVVDGETVYHLLTVPRGGQFSLTLSDGTKVWLNAASSLRYPDHFSGTERKVELTGEGYFEVAKNKEQPFIVQTSGNNEVHVLGTHFNVKAYTDENTEAITLLEGSVKVKVASATPRNDVVIKPGEQAKIQGDELRLTKSVDTEEVTAWKNKLFKFNNAPIEDIMKQVGRWYNAEIVYETKTTHHFNATIARDKPVSKLLHYLELTGQVHFKIENNKIIVMK